MVKDHSDSSERGNPLSPHGLLFPLSSNGSFYMHHPTDRIAHTTAFVIPVVEHWLEQEMVIWCQTYGRGPFTQRQTLSKLGFFTLYDIEHMAKDFLDSKRGNLLLPLHGLLFLIVHK